MDEVFGNLEPGAAPFTETHGYEADIALFSQQGGQRPSGPRTAPTYGLPVLTHHCSNNYG